MGQGSAELQWAHVVPCLELHISEHTHGQVQKGSRALFFHSRHSWWTPTAGLPLSMPLTFLSLSLRSTRWDTQKSCDVHPHSALRASLLASSCLAALAQRKSPPQHTLYPHGEEVLFNCPIPTAKWKPKIIYRNRASPWLSTIYITHTPPLIHKNLTSVAVSPKTKRQAVWRPLK